MLNHTFSALRHRNFRLFWFGQMFSFTGTWMQTVALGWLVFELTNSPFLLGLVSACNMLPSLFITPVSGAISDRTDKRQLIIFTQIGAMVLALVLGILTILKIVQVWEIAALALLLGIINAFDMPARQAFVVEMVGKEELMNAIALNSSLFNATRIIGPAIAGVLVASMGSGICFILNGLSFIPIIVGLLMIQTNNKEPEQPNGSIWTDIREGFQYVSRHTQILKLFAAVGVVTVFVMPFAVLMPIFARNIFKVGAQGLGILMSSSGVGALIGGLGLASLGNYKLKQKLLPYAAVAFSTALILFSVSNLFWFSLVCLLVLGMAMIIFIATCNTIIQTLVEDNLRGRVMGFYTLILVGFSPFGSLLSGTLAELFGARLTLTINGIISGLFTLYIISQSRQIKLRLGWRF